MFEILKNKFEEIKNKVLSLIEEASSIEEITEIKNKYLSKKGEFSVLMSKIREAEDKKAFGEAFNNARNEIEVTLETKLNRFKEEKLNESLKKESVDITLPGNNYKKGIENPFYKVKKEIEDIFVGMGYQIVDGPEVELASYNFTRLNIEEGHPSRDRSDTFYFDDNDEVLLRTQTSPMQIRFMENHKPPLCMLAPGRVFRKDEADATHSPMFHQIEGLVVDKGVTMADLKGTLNAVIREIYGSGTQTEQFGANH